MAAFLYVATLMIHVLTNSVEKSLGVKLLAKSLVWLVVRSFCASNGTKGCAVHSVLSNKLLTCMVYAMYLQKI